MHRYTRNSRLPVFSVSFFTLISRILGFLRAMTVAFYFGASGSADILNAVFSIPNSLRKLLSSGDLSSAGIGYLLHAPSDEEESVRRGVLLCVTALVILPLGLLSFVFSSHVLSFLFQFSDPELAEHAVLFFRINIFFICLLFLSSSLISFLHTKKNFLIPAVSQLFFSVFGILGIIAFNNIFSISSFALGGLLGGILQVLLLVYFVKKIDFSVSFQWKLKYFLYQSADLLTYTLTAAAASGLSVFHYQLSVFLASTAGEGGFSAVTNSFVFFHLPYGIIASSIISTAFPCLFKKSEQKEINQVINKESSGIVFLLLFLTIPFSIALFTFAEEGIAICLFHGEFTLSDLHRTAMILRRIAPGLIGLALLQFLSKYLFSQKHTIASVIFPIVSIFLHIIFYFVLGTRLTPLSALSTSFTSAVSTTSLICFVYLSTITKSLSFSYGKHLLFLVLYTVVLSFLSYVYYIFGKPAMDYTNTIFLLLVILIASVLISAISLIFLWIFRINILKILRNNT